VNVQRLRVRQPLVSVTNDGDFAYVQIGCAHVTCRRKGDRIVVVAGPGCQLAASGSLDMITVTVSSKKDEKRAIVV